MMFDKPIAKFQNAVYKFEDSLGFKNKIKYPLTFFVVSGHMFALWWMYKYAFPVKISSVIFNFIYGLLSGIGVTSGVHRYFTHRTYKANRVLHFILVILYMCAGQNSIREWVRDHRVHHKFSDTEADPHDANRGLFFSHIGWLVTRKNKHVVEKGKLIDMSDILNDPIIMWQERNFAVLKTFFAFVLPIVLTVVICKEYWYTAAAWVFFRYLLVFHSELTVNSLAHAFGYRPYNKNIFPAENWVVSFFAIGEGWHNYHHAFPWDYKAAERVNWYNVSTSFIRICKFLGLAHDLREATPEMVESYTKRMGNNEPVEVNEY